MIKDLGREQGVSLSTGIEEPKVYTVSRLTEEVQALLEKHFAFIWVEGEISNFSAPVSGHYYMVLKDDKAQIRTVMFRLQARHLKFLPENGMKVLAQGRISIYPPRGEYQLILDYLEPMGVGALAMNFEQLKKKLAAQGIFDDQIKKQLPYLPQRVAVITSPTGAAIHDFLKVIRRRFSNIEIILVPIRVQGNEAAEDIVSALDMVNRELDVDVIILTRGGGSLEDLWAFNCEEPALAIRRSNIPVISAVGHEIDITISDLAADLRAPTPSAAAELLVREKEILLDRLFDSREKLIFGIGLALKHFSQELKRLEKAVLHPGKRLADSWMRLDSILSRITRNINFIILDRGRRLETEERGIRLHSPINKIISMKQRLDFQAATLRQTLSNRLGGKRVDLSLLSKRLDDLSPLAILNRGYSITRKLPEKTILKEASRVRKGNQVQIILAQGEMECRVEKTRPMLEGGEKRYNRTPLPESD